MVDEVILLGSSELQPLQFAAECESASPHLRPRHGLSRRSLYFRSEINNLPLRLLDLLYQPILYFAAPLSLRFYRRIYFEKLREVIVVSGVFGSLTVVLRSRMRARDSGGCSGIKPLDAAREPSLHRSWMTESRLHPSAE